MAASAPTSARRPGLTDPPPPDVRLTLAARPENVGVVRHVMGAFASALRLPDRTVEDLRLAVTEACTNVVRHAYDESVGPMEVTVRPGADGIEVRVVDLGRGIAGRSLDAAGPGLGIPMMATLADDLRIEPETPHGSRVSMTFDRTPVAA